MELKIARRIARLSKQELALRAGLDLDTIVRLESGSGRELVGDLAYRSVVHLAQALGVPPTDLFPITPLLPPLPRLVPDDVPTPFDPNEERDDA
jgi:transcriptional regulator with XRE-family HTH domain